MRKSILRGLGVVGMAFFGVACGAAEDGTSDFEDRDLEAADVADPRLDIEVIDVDDAGYPNFITGKLGRVDIQPGFTAADIEASMFPVFEKAGPFLRLSPEDLVLRRASSDETGAQHFRFSQFRNGLPVLGAEVIVHVRDGEAYAINGSARGDLKAPVEPGIEIDGAMLAVEQVQEPIEGLRISDETRLAYRVAGEKMHLIYQIEVTGVRRDGLPVHDVVLVNAADGSILERMPLIHTAKNRELHNLNHGTSLPGATVRTEGQAPIGEATVDANYDLLGWVYDCYKNLFNRDSFNNAGIKMISSVHYSTSYCNAFWDGTQMVYGDGDGSQCGNLALSMDVTAHELTHAVTQNESNLTYSGESGGLNESMSDVFGNVCEWYRDNNGNTSGPVSNDTWLVGEDIWTPSTPNDALRYMNDPVRDGASLDLWTPGAGSVDVHYSSGISNLAFYLLSQGGTHPRGKTSVSVPAIGILKASKIFYSVNSDYLTASSNFAAARTASIQAATALHGASSAEVTAVGKAWEAVGVGGSTPPPGGSCGHNKCSSGGALASHCNPIVGSICAVDSYCCTTAWDSICVQEVRTVGKSLKCDESKGTCGHSLCTTGTNLANGCDGGQANCVAAICAADSYCCTTAWDSICVGEVASVCGKNCN